VTSSDTPAFAAWGTRSSGEQNGPMIRLFAGYGPRKHLQALLPPMIAKGSGMIVTLSSGWGRVTDPGFSPYCASKFAVEGLALSLAQELSLAWAHRP
jgi:NAD(P)-dependent dehydrogenase (short-subunit alcohol dehydrogenase family)